MTEDKPETKDIVTQWMEWQTKLYQDWFESARKNMESFFSAGPSGGLSGMDFTSFYQSLVKSWAPFWGGEKPAEGLGPTVLNRVQEATKVYTDLLAFWTQAMLSLSSLPPGTPLTTEKLKELSEKWTHDYQTIMQSLWGTLPPDLQETMKAVESAQNTAQAYAWKFWEPVLKNWEQVPELMQKFFKGEQGALLELSGLFRKNYEATIGKALRAPSLGYFRELVERVNRTMDAFLEFNVALSEYQALFLNTSQRAGEKVLSRLAEFKEKEPSAETFREFYQLWWTINEDTFHELFHSKEFTRLLKEVLTRGLLFRKWLDELGGQIAEFLNLPSKADMDEIYKALYDLRKEVRWQRRAILKLEEGTGIPASKESPTD